MFGNSEEVLVCITPSVRAGVPASGIWCLMVWAGADGIIIEIKCTRNGMLLNHPQTILPSPPPSPCPSVEKLSSMKTISGAKKVGDCCLRMQSGWDGKQALGKRGWGEGWETHLWTRPCCFPCQSCALERGSCLWRELSGPTGRCKLDSCGADAPRQTWHSLFFFFFW